MTLVRWNPARELTSFEDDFNRLFRSFGGRSAGLVGYVPAMDVRETKDHYVVTVELPGLTQEDVKVTVVDNSLVIKGEKRSEQETGTEKDGGYHRIERSYGSFERVLSLGTRIDRTRIAATMKDGVLTVQVPKAEEARERQISIEIK